MSAESKNSRRSLHEAGEISGRQTSRWVSHVENLVANPIVAYGLVLLIVLRELWGIWRYLDVTTGDTSSYFLDALRWAHGLHDDIVWSPLYTDFFGVVVALINNVADAVLIHRLVIVIAGAVSFSRRCGHFSARPWIHRRTLVGPHSGERQDRIRDPPVRDAAGAWRRDRPGSLEHAAGAWNGRRLLLVTAALVRQEFVIALAFLATAIVISEGAKRRKSTTKATAYLRAYGVPLLVALLLIGGAYWRSLDQGQAARSNSTRRKSSTCARSTRTAISSATRRATRRALDRLWSVNAEDVR